MLLEFRPPTRIDWPVILALANRASARVPGAGKQDEWLANRQAFAKLGHQDHLVLEIYGQIQGYGSIERTEHAPPQAYRLFVVAAPEALDTYGAAILDRQMDLLGQAAATAAWFVEFAADQHLLAFILARGFHISERFQLDSGVEAVVLWMDL